MAKAKKSQNADTAATEPKDTHAKRLTLLNDTVQDVCDRITDSGRSYTDRAIKARSVEPKVVEAGFKAMEAAIADGRRRYAEAQKDDDVGRVARVDLTRL